MSFRDSALWSVLNIKAESNYKYLTGIDKICTDAVSRAKTIRDTFPLYTLHDEDHICNVLKIMAQLLGDRIDDLNRDEAAMLILAACCHDVGMSAEKSEADALRNNNADMKLYLDSKPSEYLKAYPDGAKDPVITDELIRNYIRANHHLRAREYLLSIEWPKYFEEEMRKDLIWICASHGENCSKIDKDCPDCSFADLRLCAILLRLADILDFDISRAPQSIYEYSGFENAENYEELFSKSEWNKHQASHGFHFERLKKESRKTPYELPYSASSPSMQIEQGIRGYLDWVDKELTDCSNILRKYAGDWNNLVLPAKVLRSITPIGYLPGQYHFTLDQSQVLKLLGGEELYRDPSAFVRELLQNAIDAVRTREALDNNRPRNWRPQINIRTWTDAEGYDWFRIEDNGTGMTEKIILDHLLKVGSSYYNSDEFKKEKLCNAVSTDYTPISRFGIGILSCFMGDPMHNRVEISTKHYSYKTPHGLRLRMDGLNNYYAMYSQERGHKPDKMPGDTKSDQGLYLEEPGTVVAVRTRLYRYGKFNGFKEIVDRYVLYPPVPIHYEDSKDKFDYKTEKELMDAVHNVAPSEEREKEGVLEYELSTKQLDELRKKWPQIDLSNPPKLQLKFAALDKYTKSENLTGVIVAAKIDGKMPLVKAFFNGKTREIPLKARIEKKDEQLRLVFGLDINDEKTGIDSIILSEIARKIHGIYMERLFENLDGLSWLERRIYDEIIRAIRRFEIDDPEFRKQLRALLGIPDRILDEYINKTWERIDSSTGISQKRWQLMKEYDAIRGDVFLPIVDLDSIHCYTQFIKPSILKTKVDMPTAHNGVMCGNALIYEEPSIYDVSHIGMILLLKDRYRPEVSLARDGIQSLSLETAFDCEMIERQLSKEGYEIELSENLTIIDNKYRFLSINEFLARLNKRPDWIEQLIVDTTNGSFLANKLPDNEEMVIEEYSLPDYSTEHSRHGLYGHFLTSYLQDKYMLMIKKDYPNRVQLLKERPLQADDNIRKLFPPALFLPVENNQSEQLRDSYQYYCPSCNAKHRVSRFLINHAEQLKLHSPGGLERLISIFLKQYIDEKNRWIEEVNSQLTLIQNIPDNPFNVTNELFLKELDIG